jgi:hypothetical protein
MKGLRGVSHLPSSRLWINLLKVGLSLWCFLFGYFMGVFHSGVVEGEWASDTTGDLAMYDSTSGWSPASASTFPLCGPNSTKNDATSIFMKGHLRLPPGLGSPLDPLLVLSFRRARAQVMAGLPQAIEARSKVYFPLSWACRTEGPQLPL